MMSYMQQHIACEVLWGLYLTIPEAARAQEGRERAAYGLKAFLCNQEKFREQAQLHLFLSSNQGYGQAVSHTIHHKGQITKLATKPIKVRYGPDHQPLHQERMSSKA